MEITGTFDSASDVRDAAGQTDTKLPAEIKVTSYREPSAASAPAIASAAPAPPAPAPRASAPASNQAVATAGQLPKTASNQPLVALIAFLSLFAAAVIHVTRLRLGSSL